MSDHPHNNIQSPSEMLTTAQERRLSSRIFSKTADAGMAVEAIVQQMAEELVDIPKKADLRNTEQIRKIVICYVAKCAEAGVIPCKSGLARACGYNRRTIDLFCDRHPDHPTAELLELAFDAFAEALNTAALAGSVKEVTAIFLSKALYSYVDSVTIKSAPPDPMDHRATAAEIMARYSKGELDMLPAD